MRRSHYIDRVALSIANPLVRADLGLSVAEMGVVLSVFLWTYALCQLPVSAMIDRLGPRWLLGAGLILWSLAQVAVGFVNSMGQCFWTHVLLGIGESPPFPLGARVVWNAVGIGSALIYLVVVQRPVDPSEGMPPMMGAAPAVT